MVQMTMQVSNDLAKRIQPIRYWLPTILEIGLVGFKTAATETASEIIQFLSTNPSPQEVLAYQAPHRSQARLRRLLILNEAGVVGEMEQSELDELQKIEHIMIMLKTQIVEQRQYKGQCH